MAASPDLTIDTTSRVCETESGYLWYICTFTQPDYSGCCRVDPCKRDPVGCPPYARGVPVITSTTITTSTSTKPALDPTSDTSLTLAVPTTTGPAPSPPETTPTPSPGAGAGASLQRSAATDGPTTGGSSSSSSHGITLSISALVGIVIGCAIVALFASLSTCMWWGRRQREKKEKHGQLEKLASSQGLDVEHMPPGLESVFNPMAQSGPGSIFDRGEGKATTRENDVTSERDGPANDRCLSLAGRMSKGDSFPGSTPLPRDSHLSHLSHLSSGVHSSLVSPLTLGSSVGTRVPTSPSELEARPIRTDGAEEPAARSGAAELESRPVTQEETIIARPRATLNSTQEERDAGTYANSWTRFQNVQL